MRSPYWGYCITGGLKAGKHDFEQPIIFGSIVAVLLLLRVYWWWQKRAQAPVVAGRVT